MSSMFVCVFDFVFVFSEKSDITYPYITERVLIWHLTTALLRCQSMNMILRESWAVIILSLKWSYFVKSKNTISYYKIIKMYFNGAYRYAWICVFIAIQMYANRLVCVYYKNVTHIIHELPIPHDSEFGVMQQKYQ